MPSPDQLPPIKALNVTNREIVNRKPTRKEKLCALAFKVVNDKEKGLVTFFRVYSGVMKNKQRI